MPVSDRRITITGGVLGPLSLKEVRTLRGLLVKLKNDPEAAGLAAIENSALDKSIDWLESIIEEESTVGRVV